MRIVYFVNAAWYFELHWLDRSEAAISKGYEVHLVSNFADDAGNDSNLLIVFYVQIMPDDLVMQLHRF